MSVKCQIEVLLCNHCCSRAAMSITQSVCICSLRYPACNALAPYCHLLPAGLYIIFPLYGKTFLKGIEHIVCLLIFSTTLKHFSLQEEL